MTDRAALLGKFLREACAYRGPWNCSTDAANWCIALGHADFAAPWRDITEAAACEAVPARAGGLAILWDRGIADALPAVSSGFALGDIGVVASHGFEAGAIFTGERWAIRNAGGGMSFIALPDRATVAAWRP